MTINLTKLFKYLKLIVLIVDSGWIYTIVDFFVDIIYLFRKKYYKIEGIFS